MNLLRLSAYALSALLLTPYTALAAADHLTVPGTLSAWWIIPFAGMLLSIAVLPLTAHIFWEHHRGKISIFWALTFLVPCLAVYGPGVTFYEFCHIILLDYVPFLVLLFSLYTVAGGVRLTGSLTGTPPVNLGILAIGTVLASWMGTTGAAMLLVRPLLRANAHRKYRVHSVVFFIFLVANIGGSLSPLGDPPLFLGFLKGVDFFWTTSHLFLKTLSLSTALLAIYFVLDMVLYNKEGRPVPPSSPADAAPAKPGQVMPSQEKLGLDGKINLLFLLGVVTAVLLSGLFPLGTIATVGGVPLEAQNVLRDAGLLCLAWLSMRYTSRRCRELNGFTWGPIEEVAQLFFGIFVSMIPAMAILKAGTSGALAPLVELVSRDGQPVNAMYFWLTGILSSFLDNAPTYMVFFNTAGGDAQTLMHHMPETLAAISAGAVFMGACSYIGNAPNFMVRAIAEDQGVRMPGFFGYILWSICILVPLFALLTWFFFT
ncbi:MAG TPA: sodium:proton antiporter [Desulfovibrio sp.]|uniref:sodium:proton antiporter n=1 Tax=Desulfovibrio sp. TaxID=885 RepID=UPI002D6DE4A5|nr:sodium:proton antiporter [Desulfovibrio sp.]HZF60209.1 sodium:proton antiporter [Desulfovibrio sp.]